MAGMGAINVHAVKTSSLSQFRKYLETEVLRMIVLFGGLPQCSFGASLKNASMVKCVVL
jgi:hypothetical protein